MRFLEANPLHGRHLLPTVGGWDSGRRVRLACPWCGEAHEHRLFGPNSAACSCRLSPLRDGYHVVRIERVRTRVERQGFVRCDPAGCVNCPAAAGAPCAVCELSVGERQAGFWILPATVEEIARAGPRPAAFGLPPWRVVHAVCDRMTGAGLRAPVNVWEGLFRRYAEQSAELVRRWREMDPEQLRLDVRAELVEELRRKGVAA